MQPLAEPESDGFQEIQPFFKVTFFSYKLYYLYQNAWLSQERERGLGKGIYFPSQRRKKIKRSYRGPESPKATVIKTDQPQGETSFKSLHRATAGSLT